MLFTEKRVRFPIVLLNEILVCFHKRNIDCVPGWARFLFRRRISRFFLFPGTASAAANGCEDSNVKPVVRTAGLTFFWFSWI